MNECEVCGGQLALLGVLGRLIHSRCMQCGMDHSREGTDKELQEAREAVEGS